MFYSVKTALSLAPDEGTRKNSGGIPANLSYDILINKLSYFNPHYLNYHTSQRFLFSDNAVYTVYAYILPAYWSISFW